MGAITIRLVTSMPETGKVKGERMFL